MKHRLLPRLVVFLSGLLTSLVIVEISLRLYGSLVVHFQSAANVAELEKTDTLRVLCLGDSMTAGGYPEYLEIILNNGTSAKNIRYSVFDGGAWGIGTDYIVSHLKSNLDRYNPHVVIVMMGTPYFSDDAVTCKRSWFGELRIRRLAQTLVGQTMQNKYFASLRGKHGAGQAERPGIEEFSAYAKLARDSYGRKDYRAAGTYFRKAVENSPDDVESWLMLADVYMRRDDMPAVTATYVQAVEKNPHHSKLHLTAGLFFYRQQSMDDAEKMLKRAIALDGSDPDAYRALAEVFRTRGDLYQERQILETAEKKQLFNDRLYRALAIASLERKEFSKADEYFNKAESMSLRSYRPETVSHYRSLVKQVLSRNMQIIGMQYPVRSDKPLRRMLEGLDGVIFVENETNFKAALRKGSYSEYFRDQYGGDFGHLTEEGKMMLASRVADVIRHITKARQQ